MDHVIKEGAEADPVMEDDDEEEADPVMEKKGEERDWKGRAENPSIPLSVSED